MAGATEQEQQKTNQLLEKVEQRTTESTGKLDALIEAVKQPSEYEQAAEDISKDTKELHKTAEKHDKEIKKVTKKFHDNFDKHVQQVEDSAKKDEVHNKFIKDQEKKKEGFAKAALAKEKREDKFATRMGKGAWDWTKGKVQGVTKAVGGFFENLMKLMALMGLWFALSWLKGKDLKKMWEKFRAQIDKFIDEFIPQWIKDLSFGEQLGLGITALTSAWLILKGAFSNAGRLLTWMGNSIVETAGKEGRLNKQIMKMRGKLTDLVSRRNAIKMAMKMTDDLDIKSKLGQELKNTNQKIVDLEAKIKAKTTAMENVKKMANALADESKLSKDLKKTNKALAKASAKVNVASEAAKMAKNLQINSKIGQDLIEANRQFAKVQDTAKTQARQLRTQKFNISRMKAGQAALPEGFFVAEDGTVRTPEGKFAGKEFNLAGEGQKPKGKTGTSFWDRMKARISGVGEGAKNLAGKTVRGIGKGFSWAGQTELGKMVKGTGKWALGKLDIAGKLLAVVEAFRGTYGAWAASREKGDSYFESLVSGGGGGLHAVLDLVPALVHLGEMLAGGGISLGGFVAKALGAPEESVDAALGDFFNAYMQYADMSGGGKGISGSLQAMVDSTMGTWQKDTTIQGKMKAQGSSAGDFLGMGKLSEKVGFWEGLKQTWGGAATGLRLDTETTAVAQGKRLAAMSEEERAAHEAANRKRLMEDTPIAKLINESAFGQAWSNTQKEVELWKTEMKDLLVEIMVRQGQEQQRINDSLGNIFVDNKSPLQILQNTQTEKRGTAELKN